MTRAQILAMNQPAGGVAFDLNVAEEFRKHTTAPAGIVHRLNLPPDALVRNLWIAAAGLTNTGGASIPVDWVVEAVIRFKRQQNVIAELPVINASNATFAVDDLVLALPQSGTGFQPALRIMGWDSQMSTWSKVDVPPFRFVVSADAVEMEVRRARTGTAPSYYTDLVTGLRCVSEYPVATLK